MNHTAELIAVGTELLLGNIANTDAQILSQGLSALGITVHYHTVVGDNPQRLRAALDIARRRAVTLIPTGGPGPPPAARPAPRPPSPAPPQSSASPGQRLRPGAPGRSRRWWCRAPPPAG